MHKYDILQYLEKLGLSAFESEVFLALYTLGSKPASAIAKEIGKERTHTYKVIQKLIQKWLVAQTKRSDVAYFFIPQQDMIPQMIRREKERLTSLDEQLPTIQFALQQLSSQRYSFAPKISLFDGLIGIQRFYDDLYETTLAGWYGVITVIASNTLESYGIVPKTLADYSQDTFKKLAKKHILTDILLANGVHLMEHLVKSSDMEQLISLPAGNAAINLYIAGQAVYIVIFDAIPFGIKIDSHIVANMMHFLVEKLQIDE